MIHITLTRKKVLQYITLFFTVSEFNSEKEKEKKKSFFGSNAGMLLHREF